MSIQTVETTVVNGVPMVTLLVSTIAKKDIEALRAVCKLAGYVPGAIDLSGAAILRSLTRATSGTDDVACIVDIGATKTTVVTRVGLDMRSIRTNASGGDEITRSLITVSNEDFHLAEIRKFNMEVASALVSNDFENHYSFEDEKESTPEERKQKAYANALSSSVEQLVESIAQSIESDASKIERMPQGVILCGASSRMRGIKERVQQRLGIPVVVGKPWVRLEHSKYNASFFLDGKESPAIIGDLTVAVGLALWKGSN